MLVTWKMNSVHNWILRYINYAIKICPDSPCPANRNGSCSNSSAAWSQWGTHICECKAVPCYSQAQTVPCKARSTEQTRQKSESKYKFCFFSLVRSIFFLNHIMNIVFCSHIFTSHAIYMQWKELEVLADVSWTQKSSKSQSSLQRTMALGRPIVLSWIWAETCQNLRSVEWKTTEMVFPQPPVLMLQVDLTVTASSSNRN